MGTPRVTSPLANPQSNYDNPAGRTVPQDPPTETQEIVPPAVTLRELLAVSFLPIIPLMIFGNLLDKGKNASSSAPAAAQDAAATPPSSGPQQPNLQAVTEQFRTAYAEQLRKFGVSRAEDVDILASYFAAWGMNHWSALSESQRGPLTPAGEISRDIIERAEIAFREPRRTKFSHQRIEQLLKRARVFAWVKANEETVSANGFDAIDKRVAEIIKVWSQIPYKVKKERFGWSGGPIPETFFNFMKEATARGEDPRLLLEPPPPASPPVRVYLPSQPARAAASAVPAVTPTAPERSREFLSDIRRDTQAGIRSPESARYIMNLEAFEVDPYAVITRAVGDHLRKMPEFSVELNDYITAIAQAVVFLWNLALMRARPNSPLRHLDTETRMPTVHFIEENAMLLRSHFPDIMPLCTDAKGLRFLVQKDFLDTYGYDRQEADYIAQLAVPAFEFSFFNKYTARFHTNRMFVDLFLKHFARLKLNELEYVWNKMPEGLQEAFGRRAPGEKYPALFIEFMLSAKNGLDISYALERNERPYNVSYGTEDDRQTISRQVHEELAARYPGLLHYAGIFGQIVHRREWQRREAASTSPTGPRSEKPAPAPEQNEFAKQLSELPLISASPRILERIATDKDMIKATAAHIQTITGFRNRSMTELENLARIIAARWLANPDRTGDPDHAFIERQAESLQDRRVRANYDLLSMDRKEFDVEGFRRAVGERAEKRETGILFTHLEKLAAYAFSGPSFTREGPLKVMSIYLDIFVNDIAPLLRPELQKVANSVPSIMIFLEHLAGQLRVAPGRPRPSEPQRAVREEPLPRQRPVARTFTPARRAAAPARPAQAPAPSRPAPQPQAERYNIISLDVFDGLRKESSFLDTVTVRIPPIETINPVTTLSQAIIFLWRLHLIKESPNTRLNYMMHHELMPSYDFIEQQAKRLMVDYKDSINQLPTQDVPEFMQWLSEALYRAYKYDAQVHDYLKRYASDGFLWSFFGRPPDPMRGWQQHPETSTDHLSPVLIDLFVKHLAPLKIAELQGVWSMMPFDLQKAFGMPERGERYPKLFIEFMLAVRDGAEAHWFIEKSDTRTDPDTPDFSAPIRAVARELATLNPQLLHYEKILWQLAHHIAFQRSQALSRTAETSQRRSGSISVNGVEVRLTQQVTDASQVDGLLASADARPTFDAQRVQELVLKRMAEFADKVGGLIPDLELVGGILSEAAHLKNDPLFEHARQFLKLSAHARLYYMHLAIDEYAREVRAAFDTGRPPMWFKNFIGEMFSHRHRMSNIGEFEQQAARVRFRAQGKAAESSISGHSQKVITQIAGDFPQTGRAHNTASELASAAIRAWMFLSYRQREWFMSETIPELIAGSGELPPAFIRWFTRHVAPELVRGGGTSSTNGTSRTAGSGGASGRGPFQYAMPIMQPGMMMGMGTMQMGAQAVILGMPAMAGMPMSAMPFTMGIL